VRTVSRTVVRLCHRILPTVVLLGLAGVSSAAPSSVPKSSDDALLTNLNSDFARLAPQTIRPADGYIRYSYLIPAGYYTQMWDWDGFFIGLHWANQSPADAKYLRDWVLSFASSADATGYVAGCITPKGPRPLFGKFAMKPFLAQGALVASRQLHDYTWLRPVWPAMQRVVEYRKRTQFDSRWGLWFWDNAMQSGADNNAALSNDPKDPSAILAVDASFWAMREDLAMAELARQLGDPDAARNYQQQAAATRTAILAKLWSPSDAMFFNRRRDTGAWVRVIAWSNFLPLAGGLLPAADARGVIRCHLLNPCAAWQKASLLIITRPSSIPTRTGADRSGSTRIFSTGLRCAATAFTQRRGGWRSRWLPRCTAKSHAGAPCTRTTTPKPAKALPRPQRNRRAANSPAL
jgi:alpha,alpha-trehalase